MPISAVVLTHNDEKILQRTLEGISWCDEIVVVDDYSTDNTVSVAKKFTSHIYQRHVAGDFAGQRNFGLEHAKGPWVLFVDSDEVVSAEHAKELQRAIKQPKNGYYLKRNDWMWGKWLRYGETGRVRILRLGRKGSGRWTRPVHEVWEIAGPIGALAEPLQHYPHPNVAQFTEEINRYSSVNAQYLFN